MKLNEHEEQELTNMGYTLEDIKQIKRLRYKFIVNGKQISQKQAKEILTETDFLSGIGRSAFHKTSYRINKDIGILIESNLFEKM